MMNLVEARGLYQYFIPAYLLSVYLLFFSRIHALDHSAVLGWTSTHKFFPRRIFQINNWSNGSKMNALLSASSLLPLCRVCLKVCFYHHHMPPPGERVTSQTEKRSSGLLSIVWIGRNRVYPPLWCPVYMPPPFNPEALNSALTWDRPTRDVMVSKN